MNNSILVTTIFVVLAAAGAVAWFVLLEHQQDQALSERIDGMRPDPGAGGAPAPAGLLPCVRVTLERAFPDDPQRAHTVIAVEGTARIPLLPGWRGRGRETPERLAAHEGALARAAEALRARVRALGGRAGALRGEIVTAAPSEEAVEVLNLLLALGLADVVTLDPSDPQAGAQTTQR